jgi:hypothetical protein
MKQPLNEEKGQRSGWPTVIVLLLMLVGLLCALYLVLNPCWSGEGCRRTVSESERIYEVTERGLITPNSELVQYDVDGKTPLYTRVDRRDGTTVFTKYKAGKRENELTLRPDTQSGPRDVWPGQAEIARRGKVGEAFYRQGVLSRVDEYFDNGKFVRKTTHHDVDGSVGTFTFYENGPAATMFIDVLGDGTVRIENYFRPDGTRYQRATSSPDEFSEAFFDEQQKVTEQTFGKPKELAYTHIKYFEGGGPEQFSVSTNMELTTAREFDRSGGLVQERTKDNDAVTRIRVYRDGVLSYEQVWKTADGEDRLLTLTEHNGDSKREIRFYRDGVTPFSVLSYNGAELVQSDVYDEDGNLALRHQDGVTGQFTAEQEIRATINDDAVKMPDFDIDVPWPGQQG